MKSAFTRIIAVIVLLALVVTPVAAIDTPQAVGPYPEPDRSAFVPDDTLGTKQLFEAVEPESVLSLDRSDRYVILFEEPSLAAVSKDVQKLDTTTSQSQTYLENLAVQRNQVLVAAERTIGRDLNIIYVYDVILNGVSVELSPDEVQQLAKVDGVRKILPLPDQTLDTDAGPTWIGADGVWDDTAVPDGVGNKGEGLLVGIIDTGINFDHPSFSASPADGFVYEWTGDYLGVCAPEVSGGNPAYAAACNDKLVGAYSYTTEITADVETPEDIEGHGSHTASTVAGNEVEVNFLADTVTISGVAPHAQIIAYDVCYPTPDGNGSCDGPGILAAIEQAVADGVDVINYSISGGENPYGDATELAFLEAFGAGVVVSASGGNSGPDAATVAHRSPWVITTAASTHNRKYHDTVVNFSNPDYQDISTFAGEIPFSTEVLDSPIKYAGEDGDGSNELGCVAFSPDFFTGNIALIKRGDCAFTDKILNAQNAGATGVIIFTNAGDPGGMAVEGTSIPAVMLDVSGTVGDEIATWVTTATDDTVSLTAFYPETNDVYGDIMADFSSRGPNTTFDVLKPDVSAPGVQILAAVSDSTIEPSADYELALYGGTSMSSPHDAGAATLLYAEFPSWSPAMIKSALMLTAERDNLLKEDMETPADLFDFGAGRVDLEMAALTGLTMDETYENMVAANPAEGGDMKTLNIPSLYDSLCVGECSWTRTFTSVADAEASYTVTAPAWITVDPASFTIAAGGTQEITVTANVVGQDSEIWLFDYVVFNTDSTHSSSIAISDAAIPVAVLPVNSNIPGYVRFDTHRDADMGSMTDLLSLEITEGNTFEAGLSKAVLEEVQLDPDPTNGDPFDDLSQVFVKTITLPAYSIRLVTEITQTTASDVDIFLFWDMDASGTLDPAEDYLLADSATATALEYINAPRDFIYYPSDDTYFLVVQNWAGAAGDTITLATGIVPLTPEAGNYEVYMPYTNPTAVPFQIDVSWNEDTTEGDRLYGFFQTCTDAVCTELIGLTDIDIRRLADDVVKTADVTEALPGDTITYTIDITNYADVATDYTINDVLPAGVTYVPDSVTGGALYDELTNAITWSGTVDAPMAPYYNVTDSVGDPFCDTGFGGYANLEDFGILATAGISGDTSTWTMGSGPIPYNFYGEDYSAISFTDDGFVIFDIANNYAGAPWTNQSIPDPAFPNNLAAMLWQDMEIVYDEAANKGVSLATAGDNIDVIEYDDVQIYGDPDSTYDFEVVYYHEVDDTPYYYEIVFAYDNLVGDINAATIGLENYLGTDAATYAYNDASFSNGHMVCFDLVTPTTTQTITFQVTVDEDAAFGPITNTALHDTASAATFEEAAEAIVEIVPIEPKINEYSADHTGTDTVEFVEIFGSPVADYSAYTILEIEGDSGGGAIDKAFSAGTTDANGLSLVNMVGLENGTISILLVKDFTGATGQDIDTDNDGTIDYAPWSEIVDSVAIHDGESSDIAYGSCILTVGYDGFAYDPGAASRIPDGYDTDSPSDWVRNDYDLAGIPGYEGTPVYGEAYNTPGAFNQIVNDLPVLEAIGDKTVDELAELAFTATATDDNAPPQVLTFSLTGTVPTGAAIDPTTGEFTWTPTEEQGPGEFTFTVQVCDDADPALCDYEEITVTVNEVNVDPVLDPIGPQAGDEETLITFTATANDVDLPSQALTFSLTGTLPDGATISEAGVFTWTPTEAQGPGEFTFTVQVCDDADPALCDTEEITVTVNEVNVAPELGAIGAQTGDEGTLITFTAAATDADVPAQVLTYSLTGTVPDGAAIDLATGVFTWTPADPGLYTLTVQVCDDAVEPLCDTEEITITVGEVIVNTPPVAVADTYSTDQDTELVVEAPGVLVNDTDPEGNDLTAEMVDDVANGTLDLAADGSFTYTPEAGFVGEDSFTYKAFDGVDYSEVVTVTITVNEVAPEDFTLFLPLIMK